MNELHHSKMLIEINRHSHALPQPAFSFVSHQGTCGSGGEARRDGAARTARTSRTYPHPLILTLQTDDLVFLIFCHLAAAHVLAPGLDLHTCVDLVDQPHVGSRLMVIQHSPSRRLRSRLLRMA